MPKISLVVCVHKQRKFLERLIRESEGCYDELIVEHDIPDEENAREIVEAAGGRFFELKPIFLHEVHWPFLWGQAKHDWIFRMDSDEFPGVELRKWLQDFRRAPEPEPGISGYACNWPLWNGKKQVSRRWPTDHVFLFNKNRVRYFGMCEQGVVPEGKYISLDLTLHHQPVRSTYNLRNSLFRKQSTAGQTHIAKCLLGKPTDLPCWRWTDENWPREWEQIRSRPLKTAVKRLVMGTFRGLRSQWRVERRFFPFAAIGNPAYHVLMCLKYWRMRKKAGATKT